MSAKNVTDTIFKDIANSQITSGFFCPCMIWEVKTLSSYMEGQDRRCSQKYYHKLDTDQYMVIYHLPVYLKHPPTCKQLLYFHGY